MGQMVKVWIIFSGYTYTKAGNSALCGLRWVKGERGSHLALSVVTSFPVSLCQNNPKHQTGCANYILKSCEIFCFICFVLCTGVTVPARPEAELRLSPRHTPCSRACTTLHLQPMGRSHLPEMLNAGVWRSAEGRQIDLFSSRTLAFGWWARERWHQKSIDWNVSVRSWVQLMGQGGSGDRLFCHWSLLGVLIKGYVPWNEICRNIALKLLCLQILLFVHVPSGPYTSDTANERVASSGHAYCWSLNTQCEISKPLLCFSPPLWVPCCPHYPSFFQLSSHLCCTSRRELLMASSSALPGEWIGEDWLDRWTDIHAICSKFYSEPAIWALLYLCS